MAAGTVTVKGPYTPDDITTIASELTSEAGAIIKSLTSWQDENGAHVWFAVSTEA